MSGWLRDSSTTMRDGIGLTLAIEERERPEEMPASMDGRQAVPAGAPPVTVGRMINPGSWGTTFTSLKERDYAWFFAGNLTFFMGMQMQFILRGFLAYDLTDRASALGIIAATMSLPMLLAAPFGGVVADRVNKRTLLIVTQSAAAIASVVTAVLIITELIEFWHLIVISLITALVFSFNMPARQALVPLLVPQHKLMNAISLQMGGMNLTRIIAPAIAGVLIAPIGLGWVYLITFFFFAVATASEFKLPAHGMRADRQSSAFMDDFTGGFRYIRADAMLTLLIGASLLVPLFGFPVQQMLPVFAEDVFDRGPTGLGMLAAASGAGGLVGAIISANMDAQPRKGMLMLVGGIIMAIFLAAFALSPNFLLALLFLAIANIGQMLFMATNNTVIQSGLPEEVRGRVMSVMMMSFGMMPLGVIPITLAADAIGAPAAIAISSMGLLVALFTTFAVSRRLRELRVDAMAGVELSPVQAAMLVAEGKITQEEADRMSGRVRMQPQGPSRAQ
ncbi:MAG: MFS transporter [Dehalococcoidia bacterium]|nr:MFS transporter [Dehalococcoidia bacterium]